MSVEMKSGAEVLNAFGYLIQHYILTKEVINRETAILQAHSDEEDLNDHIQKFEKQTDEFIHSLATAISNDKSNMNECTDDVLIVLITRIGELHDALEENKDKKFPFSDDIGQFTVDCLINFWKDLNHEGFSRIFF